MKIKKITTIGIFLVLATNLFSQKEIYPEVFSSSFSSPQLINSSYLNQEAKYDLSANVRQFTGSSSEIQTLFASAAFTSKIGKGFHGLRFNILSQKEGPYIANQRLYMNYAIAIPISKEQFLNFGTDLGIFSRSYSAPSATGQGNSIVSDGKFSTSYTIKKTNFGFTLNQLFNSEGKPLSSSFKLQRYPSFFLIHKNKLTNEINFILNVHARQLKNVGFQQYTAMGLELKEQYSFGIGERTQYEMVFWGDVKLEVSSLKLHTGFYLNMPYSTRRYTLSNSLEVFLKSNF